MNNFFILGLPRSRTAWFSVFFTAGNTFCFHEAMKDCENVEAFQAKLAEKGLNYAFVGDSDASLITMDIGKFYPDAPVLVVKRDPHEAADSLIDLLGVEAGKALDIALDRKHQIKDAVRHCNNVAEVDYDHINDKLEDIWVHCIGDGFDRSRAEHLIEMNIQTIMEG